MTVQGTRRPRTRADTRRCSQLETTREGRTTEGGGRNEKEAGIAARGMTPAQLQAKLTEPNRTSWHPVVRRLMVLGVRIRRSEWWFGMDQPQSVGYCTGISNPKMNLANLTDEQHIEAEDDHRICVRRGSDEGPRPERKRK